MHLTYEQAMHGIQTGIKVLLENGSQFATPKHLRVGVDSCAVSQAALARLLIVKGVITEAEYVEAVRLDANLELLRVESEVSKVLGKKVTLR